MGGPAWRPQRTDAESGGAGPGLRHGLRRQRQRSPPGDARPGRHLRRRREGRDRRRPHHRLGGHRPRASRRGEEGRLRHHRCAGLRRPGRRRERRAHGDVRRRRGPVRARGKGDRGLCPRLHAPWRLRLRAARQDGQPDLHRRRGARPRRGPQLRAESRPRRRKAHRHHLQGRGAVLADGEPLQDHDRGQVRLRLCRRLDAQGPRHLPERSAPERRQPAAQRPRRPVLRAGAEDGRQALGHLKPDRAAAAVR